MPYHDEADLSDLFARASASDSVVIAKLSKRGYIPPRPTKEELDRLRAELEAAAGSSSGEINAPNDMTRSATLYTLDVTAPLCRQADFRPEPQEQATGPNDPVYMLTPWRERGADADVERFSPDSTYLIFIEKDPTQDQFGALYQLDGVRTYYRAHLRARGVMQLPSPADKGGPRDKATPVVSAVTALSNAVKPADYFSKIANLTGLMYGSLDMGLRHSAEAAITALRTAHAKQQ